MGRGKTWLASEDAQVTRSWINASHNAVEGADQSGARFWSLVSSDFHCKLPTSQRSADAIESRWRDISKAVSKYIGYVAAIRLLNQSGTNTQDIVIGAKESYKKHEKKEFEWTESYELLRDDPKWKAYDTNNFKPAAAPNVQQNSQPNASSPERKHEEGEQSTPERREAAPTPEREERPIGNRAAKKMKMKKSSAPTSSSSDSYKEHLVETSRRRNEILEEHNDYYLFTMPGTDPEMAREYFSLKQREKMDALKKRLERRDDEN